MRELNIVEMNAVSGGVTLTTEERLVGALWGVLDGAMTGAAVAGKVSGSGSWITGAINQLVSAAFGMVSGALSCGYQGFNYGRDAAAAWAADHRATHGSAGKAYTSV